MARRHRDAPKSKRQGVVMRIGLATIASLREAGYTEEQLAGAREVVVDGKPAVEITMPLGKRKKR